MKKILKFKPFFFSIILLFTLTTCDYFFGEEDETECDKTAFSSTKTYKTQFMVKIMYNDHVNIVNIPLSGEQVKIEFHKIACGFDSYKPGGDFEYVGKTDNAGEFYSGAVSYQVRNSNDVFITIISHRSSNSYPWIEAFNEQLSFNKYDFLKNTFIRYEEKIYTVAR
ncbi:hypothetical protein N9164_14405 [Draconibacterium sp.]|nr:hypothetical protein [Draconibacterium sp.]